MLHFKDHLNLLPAETLTKQGSEISRTRILEVWWGRKQVFPPCYRTVVCHFKRSGHLYINKSVSSFLSLLLRTSPWHIIALKIHWWQSDFIMPGMCCINTPMKMFHWDLGLLVWMWIMLMIGDYVVVHRLVCSFNFHKIINFLTPLRSIQYFSRSNIFKNRP